MKTTNSLSRDQIDRLLDLVSDHYGKVAGGEVSGYGQSQAEELGEMVELNKTLRIMRGDPIMLDD